MVETVIPKAPNATVMIVGGKRKGQVRQLVNIMLKDSDKLKTTKHSTAVVCHSLKTAF